MNCVMTAWHRHEAELRAWIRSRTGNPADAQGLNVWTNVFEELPR
jgi:hypothetical protein